MSENMISVCLVGYPAKFPVIVQTENYNIGTSVEYTQLPGYIVERAKEGNITKILLYGNRLMAETIAKQVMELNNNLEVEIKEQ